MDTLSFRTCILSDWADYNGHFNVAYYTLVFDYAARDFIERRLKFDLVDSRDEESNGNNPHITDSPASYSLSVTSSDIEYRQEIKVGKDVVVDTQILGYDAMHLHILQTMRESEENYIAAMEERIIVLRDCSGTIKSIPRKLMESLESALAREPKPDLPEGHPKLSLAS